MELLEYISKVQKLGEFRSCAIVQRTKQTHERQCNSRNQKLNIVSRSAVQKTTR